MSKAQISPISIIFYYIGFLIVWVLFAAQIIREQGQQMIVAGSLTGIEAMLAANLNLIIFIASLIFLIAGMYMTNTGQP